MSTKSHFSFFDTESVKRKFCLSCSQKIKRHKLWKCVGNPNLSNSNDCAEKHCGRTLDTYKGVKKTFSLPDKIKEIDCPATVKYNM